MNGHKESDYSNEAQSIIDLYEQQCKNLTKLNIMVVGKTGVGKSTLINSVFKEELASTGMGRPITQHIQRITKQGVPVAIYDTPGFELGKEAQDNVKREIRETIKNGFDSQDANNYIHCIWYCINTASNRVEPEEINWIKELTEAEYTNCIPVIIVLTKSFSRDDAKEMENYIKRENLNVKQIVPVLAKDKKINDNIVPSWGLDRLIKVMEEVLPEDVQITLQNVQIASLQEKKKYAHKIVKEAVVAATATGAAPIPIADSLVLIPEQAVMITKITVVFGFNVNKSLLLAYISTTIGSSGATMLGKTVAASLLKMIPGAGTVAGGAIDAGTAGVITAALGEAYIGIMELVFRGDMDISEVSSRKGRKMMSRMYKKELKKLPLKSSGK